MESLRTRRVVGALAFMLWMPQTYAQVSSELLDLAGRIEYGFYAQESRVIEAARASLARLIEVEPFATYYDGLAAYRLAQLTVAHDGRSANRLLEECVDRGRAHADHGAQPGEAWVLVAACSALGGYHEPLKAMLHQRRLEQALEEARGLDAENPRISLVETWAMSHRPAHAEAQTRDLAGAHLERALQQFRIWRGPPGSPEWGEAETLAHLGEISLQRGDVRGARDYIEEALLIAPDYHFALSLKKRVLSPP